METQHQATPLFSIVLKKSTGERITAKFFPPEETRSKPLQGVGLTTHWLCRIRIRVNNQTATKFLPGDNWLQALLMAVEYLRSKIPIEDEQDWKTPDGVPSWVLLPKIIPYSWGYSLHLALFNMVNAEVSSFISSVEKRRKPR